MTPLQLGVIAAFILIPLSIAVFIVRGLLDRRHNRAAFEAVAAKHGGTFDGERLSVRVERAGKTIEVEYGPNKQGSLEGSYRAPFVAPPGPKFVVLPRSGDPYEGPRSRVASFTVELLSGPAQNEPGTADRIGAETGAKLTSTFRNGFVLSDGQFVTLTDNTHRVDAERVEAALGIVTELTR
jgi:hypothetical protein